MHITAGPRQLFLMSDYLHKIYHVYYCDYNNKKNNCFFCYVLVYYSSIHLACSWISLYCCIHHPHPSIIMSTRDFDTDVKNHTRDFDNSITINQYINFILTKIQKVAIIFSLVEQPRSPFGRVVLAKLQWVIISRCWPINN